MKPLIYTNWRGKSFVIDEAFVEDMKRRVLDNSDDPSEWDYLTSEKLFEVLPVMEAIERYAQLEEAWNRS